MDALGTITTLLLSETEEPIQDSQLPEEITCFYACLMRVGDALRQGPGSLNNFLPGRANCLPNFLETISAISIIASITLYQGE